MDYKKKFSNIFESSMKTPSYRVAGYVIRPGLPSGELGIGAQTEIIFEEENL